MSGQEIDYLKKLANEIVEASPKGRWLLVDQALQDLIKGRREPPPEAGTWSDALFAALRRRLPSMSRSYFTRMLTAADFLRHLADRHGKQIVPEDFEGRALAAIDLARRLHDFNEEAALELISRIQMGTAGVAEAEEALADAKKERNAGSAPPRQRAWSQSQAAEEILRNDYASAPFHYLLGLSAGGLQRHPRTLRFGVACDAYARILDGPEGGSCVGFEILLLSPGRERLGWHRRLGQLALSASFFSIYWLVIITEQADPLLKDLDDLQLANVGVAIVGDEKLIRIRQPRLVPPIPDRRPLLPMALALTDDASD